MYTGIISDIGRVRSVRPGGVTRFEIETAYDTSGIAIGASVAVGGPCFTVVAAGPGWFAVEASRETLERTTADAWVAGTPVNLERSLRIGDEIGGHWVSGHVDGVAVLAARAPDGDSVRLRFRIDNASLARFVAAKGSVAVDGVSLTVNDVCDIGGGGAEFGVNVIPHTASHTTLGGLAVGGRANIEVDLMARYVARLHDAAAAGNDGSSNA